MASAIMTFSHLQIPLEDILEATNNFNDKNVIGHGGLGKVYKGRLLRSGKWVKIAARRLDDKHKQGIEFWTEISALSGLKHENIVSLIGFCDEKGEKVIVNKHEVKGSLVMYLSKPTLTWVQRLKICVGVARALSYIHTGNRHGYSVIHRNINSSTILLDKNFEAKLSGFEYSINHSVHRMDQVLFSEAIGTIGYMDPAIEKTGGVTHKSDIYSFGVVLWEVLYQRKAFIPDEFDRFLAPLARFHSENTTLNETIQPLRNQMAMDSLDRFSKAAYSCLNDERVQRPDMNYILHELEEALEFQLPYEKLFTKNLEHLKFQLSDLKIRLADIMLATDNFSEAYFIRKAGRYDVYRAELEHFDKEKFAHVEEKSKSELPKRRTTVIIKRLLTREDKQGEEAFFTEVEILTSYKHRNIVSLLGYCDEGFEKILVIEHLSNGFLDEYLLNIKAKPLLTWTERLKICLDVAYGLSYLHYEMEGKKRVINRNIKSGVIALDANGGAKIVDFGRSLFLSDYHYDALYLNLVVGTKGYKDPEYMETGKLKRESDVYSFGVVLFEIFCGRIAYDPNYVVESDEGLAFVVRRCFHEGTLKEMIDPSLMEEGSDNSIMLTKGPNKDSLDIFVKIAYQCLAKKQYQRPTMKVVVKELEKALAFQEQVQHRDSDQVVAEEKKLSELKVHENLEPLKNALESLSWNNRKGNIMEPQHIGLSDIRLATNNFSSAYSKVVNPLYELFEVALEYFDKENFACVEENSKRELPKICNMVIVKRFLPFDARRRDEAFLTDIEMLTTCKHRNIVTLIGFCEEDSEKILVLEHFSKGYLEGYFLNIKDKPILTWAERLRICIDVACGLKYLHHEMEDQKTVINCNIRSLTIALDENKGAKIIDFAYSVFLPLNQDDDALYQEKIINGTHGYSDPEYIKTGKLKRESDVYSFGVVLLNIFCGRVDKLLGSWARRRHQDGTLMEMIDPIINEESSGNNFSLIRGPNKKSLNAFLNIACQCVEETQDQRPTMKVVVEELEKSLDLQENNKDDNLRISLEDIQLATQNFHKDNCVGGGGFGNVYKGKLPQGENTIVAKRLDTTGGQGEQQFRNELQILFEYKHENIIRFVGYCDEKDAKIIVYEYASRGSLDRYLNDISLTWMKRLHICIDVATALDFLHRGVGKQATVIHRDIKTANILLTQNWDAKLADFGLSLISAINKESDYAIDRACGTEGYVDPLYLKSRFLTKESDIYSFGVVLFEILCGRSTFMIHKQEGVFIPSFVKHSFEKGKQDEVVFEKIKAQIKPEALTTFQTIASRCLHENREERPKAEEVVEQLKKALELQLSYHSFI